jgi:hypothetical protein
MATELARTHNVQSVVWQAALRAPGVALKLVPQLDHWVVRSGPSWAALLVQRWAESLAAGLAQKLSTG